MLLNDEQNAKERGDAIAKKHNKIKTILSDDSLAGGHQAGNP